MSTFDKVLGILSKDFDLVQKNTTPKTHLIRDVGLDSIDLYDLTFAIEEEFGISVPTDQWIAENSDLSMEDSSLFEIGNFCLRIDSLRTAGAT